MHQVLDGDGSTENAIIVRKNRCFQSKTAVFMGIMGMNDTISEEGQTLVTAPCFL